MSTKHVLTITVLVAALAVAAAGMNAVSVQTLQKSMRKNSLLLAEEIHQRGDGPGAVPRSVSAPVSGSSAISRASAVGMNRRC